MKNKFSGKYYKFINNNGFSFAIIIANSNEGKSVQLITKKSSYNINNINQVQIINEHHFIFEIEQDNLLFKGNLLLKEFHPLKKKVMGPFSYIPFMECKHSIYSMYHDIEGVIQYNDIKYDFNNGYGYIEGDSGTNFPKKYIWYNSLLPNHKSITVAVANIPFLFFSFTGVLGFIKIDDKEYYLCTWNNVKIKKLTDNHLELKKGKYKLIIDTLNSSGHNLKAPVKGSMNRYIKENIAIESKYQFLYKDEVILDGTDLLASCEWMWDDER